MIATLFLLAAAATAAPLTVEDYATIPAVGSPRISPDGRRVAYTLTRADLTRSDYDTDLWLVNTDGSHSLQLTRSKGDEEHPRWSPDGSRLAFLSDREGRSAIYVIDPDGGEAERLTDEPAGIYSFEWSPDGKTIAFLRQDPASEAEVKRIKERDDARVVGENLRSSHVYLLDLDSRKVRALTSGPRYVFTFSWSPGGHEIVFSHNASSGLDSLLRADVSIVNVASGEVRSLVALPGGERAPVFSPDGKSVAFTTMGDAHDWLREQSLHVVSLADGKLRKLSSYDRMPDDLFWSPDSRSIWFSGPMNTTNQLHRVDAAADRLTRLTNVEGVINAPDINFRTRTVAFVQHDLTNPPEIYVSSLDTFAPRRLTNHAAAYRDRALGATRLVRWKNPKDGLAIDGFLTLPLGYEPGKRYPLITVVHGGPASRFDHSFLGYLGHIYPANVLASKGFAVFRPNPRGTGGYGEQFRAANRSDWGGMDWVDISAGIDALIEQGVADPKRLGLAGWSYGGFMAAWAIGHGGERFRAISIGAPVVDLMSFHGTADIRDFIPSYFPGMPRDLLRERSPLWSLTKIDAPVLIQHGDDDDRVPLSQGTMLYRVLQELGVDVTMVVYPRTPHIPREPKLRMDVARRNVEFFEKYVK